MRIRIHVDFDLKYLKATGKWLAKLLWNKPTKILYFVSAYITSLLVLYVYANEYHPHYALALVKTVGGTTGAMIAYYLVNKRQNRNT